MKNYVAILCLTASIVLSMPLMSSADGWVLWEKGEVIKKALDQSIYWNIVDAYPLYEHCTKGKVRMWQFFKNEAEKKKETIGVVEVKTAPDLVIERFNDNSSMLSWSHTLYCLPGTIDPRERR